MTQTYWVLLTLVLMYSIVIYWNGIVKFYCSDLTFYINPSFSSNLTYQYLLVLLVYSY